MALSLFENAISTKAINSALKNRSVVMGRETSDLGNVSVPALCWAPGCDRTCRLHRDQVTVLEWPFCWWPDAAQGACEPLLDGENRKTPRAMGGEGGNGGAGHDGCLVSLVLLVLAPARCCWEMPELSLEVGAQLPKLV